MKFDLLLLFALVGCFCTISHASTFMVPTQEDLARVTEATGPTEDTSRIIKEEDITVTNAPALAASEIATKETEMPPVPTIVSVSETDTPSYLTDASTALLPNTDAPENEQETPVGATGPPEENTVVDTIATESTPEDAHQAGHEGDATEATLTNIADEPAFTAESGKVIETDRDEVEVEDSEGLSTGQVVGIVFGALVSVVIIIAVIVVVVRRMGQYSP